MALRVGDRRRIADPGGTPLLKCAIWTTSSPSPVEARLPADRQCTRVRQHIKASRQRVYRALLDPDAVAIWMVPRGMTSCVHAYDAREGGSFRVSLTYDRPDATGKTSAGTDAYHGHFIKLVPNEQVVEVMEFETPNADLLGQMTVTFTLTEANGGTDVLGVHDNVPPGVAAADNEKGWRMALEKLAALVEAGDASGAG
jgi:uncharacterized protein YndB with AHSA1/START domain